jgi:hypothetical protein
MIAVSFRFQQKKSNLIPSGVSHDKDYPKVPARKVPEGIYFPLEPFLFSSFIKTGRRLRK